MVVVGETVNVVSDNVEILAVSKRSELVHALKINRIVKFLTCILYS